MTSRVSEIVFVLTSILLVGCSPDQPVSPEPDVVPDNSPWLTVSATSDAADLWRSWNHRYVIFVHRENPVSTLRDFGSGRPMQIATFGSTSILSDLQELLLAGGLHEGKMEIKSNPDVYREQFLQEPAAIAIMATEIAKRYQLHDEPGIVEVKIE